MNKYTCPYNAKVDCDMSSQCNLCYHFEALLMVRRADLQEFVRERFEVELNDEVAEDILHQIEEVGNHG